MHKQLLIKAIRCSFIFVLILVPAFLFGQLPNRLANISLERIQFENGPSYGINSKAYLSFDMLPGDALHFFTARLTNLNTDSTKIVAGNIPLIPIPDTQRISYMIDMSSLNTDMSAVFWCEYEVSAAWIDISDFAPDQDVDLVAEPVIYRIPGGNGQSDYLPTVIPFPPPEPPITPPILDFDWVFRGDSVPNIDLNSDSLTDDWMSCGPASAANSLQWLVGRHEEMAHDTTTLREKVEKLKEYMHRSDSMGVRTDSMIVGKLALIDELQLPIRVKYLTIWDSIDAPELASTDPRYGHFADNMGGFGFPPDFDYLRNEIDDGEDVEINVGYYSRYFDSLQIGEAAPDGSTVIDTIVIIDSDGNPIDTIVKILGAPVREGGHFMVATGYLDGGDTARGIWVNDDTDQESAGGTRQIFFKWEESDDANMTPVLTEYDSVSGGFILYRGAVESVISESYDPDVEFNDLTDLELGYHPVNYLEGGIHDYPFDAYVSFSIPAAPDWRYFNVGASLPGSGDMNWIIRNLPLSPEMSGTGYYKFDAGAVTQNQPLPDTMRFFVGLGDSTTNFQATSFIDLPTMPVGHRLPNGSHVDSDTLILHSDAPDVLFGGFITSGDYRPPASVPNIDLDISRYPYEATNPASTDLAACGPAATANSLTWLDSESSAISLPDNLRNTLDSLKVLMRLNAHGEGSGVTERDLIRGKLAFIDEHQLPIHVKFQSAKLNHADISSPNQTFGHSATNETDDEFENTWPELDWLANEMENGENVEVLWGKWDPVKDTIQTGDPLPPHHIAIDTISSGVVVCDTTLRERTGGHWINLQSAVIHDGQGHGTISYKHDIDPFAPGGDTVEWSSVTEDYAGRPIIWSESPGRTRTYIETVVSESYDPSVSFCTQVVTSPADTGVGTLRDAIRCSEMGDTIRFADNMRGELISLSTAPLLLDRDVTIMVSQADSVYIRATNVQRVFVVFESVQTRLIGLNLIGSSMQVPGRSIHNFGDLTLDDVVISNTAGESTEGSQVENAGGNVTILGLTRIIED